MYELLVDGRRERVNKTKKTINSFFEKAFSIIRNLFEDFI